MLIRLFNDYQNNRYVTIDPEKVPHQLYTGQTGSGKTYASQISVAKIIKYHPNSELYLLDFKGDDDFTAFNNFERYFRYKDCELGMTKFHERLAERLNGQDESRSKIILYADELNSFFNSLPKKDRDTLQTKLAECLAMGRSMGISVICCLQRADAEFFKNGARDNFSLKVGLGNLSTESKRILFPNTDIEFSPCNTGFGYVSILGNEPLRIGIPFVNRFDLVQEEIMKALTNNLETKS